MSAVVIDIDDDEPPQKKSKASEPGCVVDLTSDDDAASRAPAEHDPPPASPPPPAAPAVPRWKRQRGVKRILGEVRDLQRQIASGALPQLSELALVEGDACDRVQFRVSNFDDALPGGRQLNADLAALAARRGSGGQDYIQMEIRFPVDYPTQPPFLRCISPRFVWCTNTTTFTRDTRAPKRGAHQCSGRSRCRAVRSRADRKSLSLLRLDRATMEEDSSLHSRLLQINRPRQVHRARDRRRLDLHRSAHALGVRAARSPRRGRADACGAATRARRFPPRARGNRTERARSTTTDHDLAVGRL